MEGWLRVGTPDPKKLYMSLEGYVLRTLKSDAPGSPATDVLDLRQVVSIAPVDVYEPGGAIRLESNKAKPVVLAVIDVDENDVWLSHLCAAVPDSAVASVFRNTYRTDAEVISLMREHSGQLSAVGLSAKAYDKKRAAARAAAAKKRAADAKKKPSSSSGSSVGNALAAAREKRSLVAGIRAFSEKVVEPAAEEAEAKPAADDKADDQYSAALAASAEKRRSMAAEEYFSSGSDGEDYVTPADLQAGSSRPSRLSQPSMRRISEPADEGDQAQGWWFIKNSDGSISGPISEPEMRKRYLADKLRQTTLVRLVVRLSEEDEAPTAEGQTAEPFSPLREMMIDGEPPFNAQAAPRASRPDAAPSLEQISEPAEAPGDERGWWFVKSIEDGSVSGPIAEAEMRKQFLARKLKNESLVRLVLRLGGEVKAPTAEGQAEEPFSPLQEMMIGGQPPFM